MSDEKALLAAIWEHPQEDAAMLVYADWLQESGEPLNVARAEFIRVQCELARLHRTDLRRSALMNRSESLKKKHSGKWKNTKTSFVRLADYERGFPYPRRSVRICWFNRITDAEWNEVPLWNVALVQHSRKAFVALPDSPHLLRIGRLALETGEWRDRHMHPDDVIRLLRSPHMRNLSEFVASYHNIGPWPFIALAESQPLPHLTSLHASGCRQAGDALSALIGSGYPAQLTTLNWGSNGTAASQVIELFRSANRFTRLQWLSLHFNWETTVDVNDMKAALTACEPFPELRTLQFHAPIASDWLATVIAAWPGLARIQSLSIPGGIGMAGAEALANSPHAPASFVEFRCPLLRSAPYSVSQLLRDRFGPHIQI